MMLHRHQEGDLPENMTRLEDVTPYRSSSTDPEDPLYVPVEEEEAPKKGRKKSN